MDQHSVEKCLALLYPLITGISLICSITSAIAWNHWKYVLDYCVETNCGCFLYGVSTKIYYLGGHIAYCHFAVYGLSLPVTFAVIFGCFHVYRTCIGSGKRKTGTTTIRQRSGDMIVVTAQSELTDNEISPHYWIPASVISCVMAFYTLVYSSIYTDGFLQSCKEYRNELVKVMIASGNTVAAIRGRISCAAVFDFMDYLHLDVSPERRREDRINSASCFYIALISGWVLVILWIMVCVLNIISARSSRIVRV